MKILLTGRNGQVGWELNRTLMPLGEVVALGRFEADMSDPEALRKVLHEANPDIIVNAAAYTAVDKAEEEKELSAVINGVAPGVLAEEAKSLGALLVHYSTDYVFDGTKAGPYLETDLPNPVNEYGRTKLAGEQAVQSSGCDFIIFRTSWVYASRGNNFLLTVLKLAKERRELSVVVDQVGSPTSARLIAETTALCIHQAIREKQAGHFSSDLYHLTASGCTTWYDFSRQIIESAGDKRDLKLKLENINAIDTSQYTALAERPKNSQLSSEKLQACYMVRMPHWIRDLEVCIEELNRTRE